MSRKVLQKGYRWCFVPLCDNTSKSSNKTFVRVPVEPSVRKKWFEAARRRDYVSEKQELFCCEDHFDLEQVMDNYIKWKLVGGRIFMKKDAVPKYFECQNRSRLIKPERDANIKRRRKKLIEEIISTQNNQPAGSSNFPDRLEKFNEAVGGSHDCSLPYTLDEPMDTRDAGNSVATDTGGVLCKQEVTTSNKSGITRSAALCEKGIPVKCAYKRRKQCQVNMKFPVSKSDAASSPFKIPTEGTKASPVKKWPQLETYLSSSEQSDRSASVPSDSSSYHEKSASSVDYRQRYKECGLILMKTNLRLYCGIPQECYFLLDIILEEKGLKLSERDLFLTLKKLCLNDTFAILANDFAVTPTHASRIFHSTLSILCTIAKPFIIEPSPKEILANLPIPFRLNYSKTTNIIDCLEVEIEKPSSALHQALSWSEYKHCNTVKYLISSTPNGIVNFISAGYGGGASDIVIAENSKFFDTLTPFSVVVADRGFKGIEMLLQARDCKLIRPPSVSSKQQSTKADVTETRQITSLRIHIERVIRRVREFKMLGPHSCIDKNLIPCLDKVVTVACALVNIQGKIIK